MLQSKIAAALMTQLNQQAAIVDVLKRNMAALEKAKDMLEIEAELVEMKVQLLGSGKLQKTYLLPAASPADEFPSKRVIDAELEELRSHLDHL